MDEITNAVEAICKALNNDKQCHIRCKYDYTARIIECRVREYICCVRLIYIKNGGYWLVFKDK